LWRWLAVRWRALAIHSSQARELERLISER
jgi:hypothetical protein